MTFTGVMPAVAGTALLALFAPALAQVPALQTQVPTRDEITRPVAPPPQPAPRLKVEGGLERSPCPLADPQYAAIKVTVRTVRFNGLRPEDEAAVTPSYARFVGSDRPVSDICEIRDAAATALRQKGYLAAVQVPTQQIENGEVAFEVRYARLTQIRVRGNAGASERLVAGYLSKLTEQPVFNQLEAERYLLLARDLPGLDVNLSLKPAGAPGELYGEVTLIRTPVSADLNIQNLAADETGRFGGQARVQFNGLTGLGDQTSIAFYSTADFREQRVLQLGHDFRLGAEGLQLGGHFTYAWTHPSLRGQPDLIRARTLFANAEARYPLLRGLGATLYAAGGLDVVNQTVRFAGTPIARDRLRVGYLKLEGDVLDRDGTPTPRWHGAFSLELRQGLNIFNATERPPFPATMVPPSRIDGDARGTLVRGAASGEFSIVPNVTLALTATGQKSFDPLLSFEEYSAGNYTIGRGYDPGTLLGDDGLGFSIEARLDRVVLSRSATLQPFVFAEAAKVWNRNGYGDDRLISVGGGVRTAIAGRFRLDLTLAVPTVRAGLTDRKPDPRLLLSLTTRLWPWSN